MANRRIPFLALILILMMASYASVIGREENSDQALHENKNGKLSEEIVMFGNQQNKPAGMIDEALAQGFKQDDDENGDKREQENRTNIHADKRAPIISEGGIENALNSNENLQKESEEDDQMQSIEDFYQKPNLDNTDTLEMINADLPYENLLYRGLENIPGMNYPGYFDNPYRRLRRNAINHRRGIRASLDQLLNNDRSGRFKRELQLTDDEILDLLGYMPKEQRQDTLEAWENQNFLKDLPSMQMLPEDLRNYDFNPPSPDMYEQTYNGGLEQDPNNENEEEDESWPFVRPLPKREMRHLNFFPPKDYENQDDEGPGNPDWEQLREHFFNRRLQGSEEETADEPDDVFASYENQNEAMPKNNRELEDLYRQLIW